MSSATPADVLARRRHLLLSGDADGFAELFAPVRSSTRARTRRW
jgi:hypothetical protein